jgi:hypothetical protein
LLILVSFLRAEVSVTIYNQDLGLVRETRERDFARASARSSSWTWLPTYPTSVHFTRRE